MPTPCTKCDLPLRDDQHFCPRCGTENAVQPMNPVSATIPEQQPAPSQALSPSALSPKEFYDKGIKLLTSAGGEAERAAAVAALMNAVDLGHVEAMYVAGMMYLRGVGVIPNRETAEGLLGSASSAGLALAGDVLAELGRGTDADDYPMLPIAAAAPKKESTPVPQRANKVTPGRILTIVLVVLLVLGGAIGGLVYYSAEKQRKAEELALVLQREKEADELRVREEAERQEQERAALEEKRQLEEQLAQLQKRNQELEQDSRTPREGAGIPANASYLPESLIAVQDRAGQVYPHLIRASLANDNAQLSSGFSEIKAGAIPGRGDRRKARQMNEQGLAAMRGGDLEQALRHLVAALESDPADQEIAGNLGYVLLRAGQYPDAKKVLLATLGLNSERSSTWFNLGLTEVRLGHADPAYAALLNAYRLSENQAKTKEWLQRFAQDENDRATATIAGRVLNSIR